MSKVSQMNRILRVSLSLHWLKAPKQTPTLQTPSQKRLITSFLSGTLPCLFCQSSFFKGALHFPLLWQHDPVKKQAWQAQQKTIYSKFQWLNLRKSSKQIFAILALVLIILPKHYTGVSEGKEISNRPTNSTSISECHSNYSLVIMLDSWKRSVFIDVFSSQTAEFMLLLFKGKEVSFSVLINRSRC